VTVSGYPTYPMLVRDSLLARLQALPFFTSHGFNFYTNKALVIQPEHIPFAAVYFIEETNMPDGDANVGDVRFRCSARYGFSVIIQNNDATAAENKLDEAMAAINSLFTDPRVYNWDGSNGPAKIQAFTRGARSHQFGSIGAESELPVAELRFDLTCDLGVILYDPPVVDDFITLHVETRYPPGISDGVQQVVVQYDIPQGEMTRLAAHLHVKVNATIKP
jgi:hypothetical protein